MAVTNFPTTLLATSQPLNLCSPDSIPYFPAGAIDIGVSSSGSIFSVDPTILVWNFDVSAGWFFFAGMCGPSIALQFNLAGSYDGSSLTATLNGDQIQGGFLFGLTAGVDLNFAISEASLVWVKDGWHSHLETVWNSKFSTTLNIQFDMIGIILTIVLKILEEDGQTNTLLQKVNDINPNLLASYGLFDEVTNGFVETGDFSVRPGFSLPINFVEFIPGLSEINEALEALAGGLFIGPTIGITIPAQVNLTDIEVGGQNYSNLQISGSTVSGTSTGPAGGGSTLEVGLTRTPGLDFTLGIGANISICKIFSLGGSYSVDILELLGIQIDLGTFPTSLSNTVGSTTLAEGKAFQLAEVILEAPAA